MFLALNNHVLADSIYNQDVEHSYAINLCAEVTSEVYVSNKT